MAIASANDQIINGNSISKQQLTQIIDEN
jgi:hypothetical protein